MERLTAEQSQLARIAELRLVCAEAYQLAGMVGAPGNALDNLAAASQGTPLPHETFLPIRPEDCSEISTLRKERDAALSDGPGTPRARLRGVLQFAKEKCGHEPISAKPGELTVIETVERLTSELAAAVERLELSRINVQNWQARAEAAESSAAELREKLEAETKRLDFALQARAIVIDGTVYAGCDWKSGIECPGGSVMQSKTIAETRRQAIDAAMSAADQANQEQG